MATQPPPDDAIENAMQTIATIPSHYTAECSTIPRTTDSMVYAHTLRDNLKILGIESFPAMQATAISHIRNGYDLVLSAEAGSGKAFCYMVPLIDMMMNNINGNNHTWAVDYTTDITAEHKEQRMHHGEQPYIAPKVIIILPTHESAEEHCQFSAALCENTSVTVGILHKGRRPIQEELHANAATDILIACPGALDKSIGCHEVGLELLEVIVFDRAVSLIGSDGISQQIKSAFFPDDLQRWHLGRNGQHVRRIVTDALLAPDTLSRIEAMSLLRPDDPPRSIRQHVKLRAEVADRRKYNLVTVTACTEREFEHLCAEWVIAHCPAKTLIFAPLKSDVKSFTTTLRGHAVDTRDIFGITNNNTQEYRLLVTKRLHENPDTLVVACKIIPSTVNMPRPPDIVFFKPPATIEDFVARADRTTRGGAQEGIVTLLMWEADPQFAIQRALFTGFCRGKSHVDFEESNHHSTNDADNQENEGSPPTSRAALTLPGAPVHTDTQIIPTLPPHPPPLSLGPTGSGRLLDPALDINQPDSQRWSSQGHQGQHQMQVFGRDGNDHASRARGRGRSRRGAQFH